MLITPKACHRSPSCGTLLAEPTSCFDQEKSRASPVKTTLCKDGPNARYVGAVSRWAFAGIQIVRKDITHCRGIDRPLLASRLLHEHRANHRFARNREGPGVA